MHINPKEHINIVWLKRDLRLHDNEAVFNALQSKNPVLLVYVFENSLKEDDHYSERHWNFIKQSLNDINKQLAIFNTKVLAVSSEVIKTFSTLQQFWKIDTVFSHQETGIKITYDRDRAFKVFCKNNLISWKENSNNGIFRGLKNRDSWREDCESYMNGTQFKFNPDSNDFISLTTISEVEKVFTLESLETEKNTNFQEGGSIIAEKYLHSFFYQGRYKNYSFHISKPELARKGCSRLSPYLAWGNLSVRQVWQYAIAFRANSDNKKQIDAFTSRLNWQVHFVQKFEMEEIMEFESINKGYHILKKKISLGYQDAWKDGKTGYPLVDACMRCLKETGYINFRMRAMVVSFFTHNLWQPWQAASAYLSSLFLDFEPGIHFPQLQMQAGETGINMLRIYNPIKNSMLHDPEGVFIKKWVPELQNVPVPFIHEPYKMTTLDQKFNNVVLGEDYPFPIVDMQVTRKKASDALWKMKDDALVKKESYRILKTHTLPNRKKLE
ncbi:deoxyribodipyrimidine photolyase [Aquimarina sp. AD10]|uniref:cryptochrome/deoxyribodipyrimidine photo-lyase family protein n=1 Tax=Aquimarina sp. AD10 TaxID=1714849 RepID=UPI000E4EF904|nr:FAD-binding domain-containing protein [Aquimarina sp. AD10]AXT62737.1 deoxyribodipyrimidine photolyase [Aquimarina sp. AD10]RKN01920.1 deoxyribodipyrimidine photolyase [Aquimarina sp. AD10]